MSGTNRLINSVKVGKANSVLTKALENANVEAIKASKKK